MIRVNRPHRRSEDAFHRWTGRVLAVLGLLVPVVFVIAESFHSPVADFLKHALLPIGIGLLSYFYLALVYGQDRIRAEMTIITGLTYHPENPEWCDAIQRSLPKDFWTILGPELEPALQNIRRAKVEQSLLIEQRYLTPRFLAAYVRTLQHFPNATFYATALATSTYWKVFGDKDIIHRHFDTFLRHGRMRRIFFIDDVSCPSEDECDEMLAQSRLGVEVLLASKKQVAGMSRDSFFFVEYCNNRFPRIAWEVTVQNDQFRCIKATVNPVETSKYLEIWKSLEEDGIAAPVSTGRLEVMRQAARQRGTRSPGSQDPTDDGN